MTRRKTAILTVISCLLVAAIAAAEYHLAVGFGKREIEVAKLPQRPNVTFTRPSAGEINVLPNSFVSCDVNLPNPGHGIDANTMTDDTVRLIRADTGEVVPIRLNTSGAGDSIVCQPDDLLLPHTVYRFEVTDGLHDTMGAAFVPFSMTFTTASGSAASDYPVAFEKVLMPHTQVLIPGTKRPSAYTCIELGPDHKLYASTFDGRIFRYVLKADGTLSEPEIITSVQSSNRGPRLITGIVFDPSSTPQNVVMWVSHGQMAFHEGRIEGADDWTGKISVLRGADLKQYQDMIIGLPRAYKDHLNFQPEFGPDGALYFCQGGHTSVGAPDRKWNFRQEHLLTGACLRVDTKLITNPPLDVRTDPMVADGRFPPPATAPASAEALYDPFAPGAPLTIYATGIRSGFDLLWHTNGHLYSGMNGGAAGGNTPAGPGSPPYPPAINDIKQTMNDLLLDIKAGGYYGHPNLTRHEYVLYGGNPTPGVDPFEVTQYPIGVRPDSKWVMPAYDFGKNVSPNGLTEYKGQAFGGLLDGTILVTRYSGGKDIIVLKPGPDGKIVEAITGIDGLTGFSDPLDLTEDENTGNLYVAEYGGRQLTLLKPKPGTTSQHVFKQEVKP
jgi:glucose/arabinose dehydrogenase